MKIKIKLHSSVDLITNSSTVIYTYSNGSISAVKELVNEMLKVFGHEDKTFDDLFYAGVFLEEDYHYYEVDSFPEVADNSNFLEETKRQVMKGEIEKPDWMTIAEGSESWSGYSRSTNLEIMPKDEKYGNLANKLLRYLYSTDHDATRDG